MTVLLVGNSVSLPPAPGVPAYSERLAAMVNGQWSVEAVLRSGETVEQMEPEILAALRRRPDRMVLQVGINECAPRPLSVAERERLGRLRPQRLRSLVIRGIHRFRPHIIRARRLHQFTPLPRFVASARQILSAAAQADCPALVLPITTVTSTAERRTPFTNREIARYNAALSALASQSVRIVRQEELFGPATPEELCVTRDSVHLGAAAHTRIAEFIASWLDTPRAATRSTIRT